MRNIKTKPHIRYDFSQKLRNKQNIKKNDNYLQINNKAAPIYEEIHEEDRSKPITKPPTNSLTFSIIGYNSRQSEESEKEVVGVFVMCLLRSSSRISS